MVQTRTRNVLRYALILQVLLWLVAPGTAFAASAPPAERATLQPMQLEQPTVTGVEQVPAALSVGEELQLGTGGTQSAPQPQASPSTTLTVSILSTKYAMWTSSSSKVPPRVVVIHARVTNTGPAPATSPALELDYSEDPAGGWTLMAGEYPVRTPPAELAPGESFHGYWFARYPNAASSHSYTVTASAGNADPVSASANFYGNPPPGNTIATEDSLQTGNTAQVQASAEVVVGVAFTVTLTYDLGQTPVELIFSPVGNVEFDPSAYRLLATHVQVMSDDGTQSANYPDQLYIPNPPSYAGQARVDYTFVAVKLADVTLCPYVGVRDAQRLKYDNDYCAPGSDKVIQITGSLSLDMVKQVDSATVQQGQLLSYAVEISNTGPYTLSHAWVWDQVPYTLGRAVGQSTGAITYTEYPGLYAWSLPTILPYASDTFTVTFLVDGDGADIPDETPVVNTAYFGINPGALPPEAALTRAVTSTVEAPWIVLSKSDGHEEVNPGDVITYTVHVVNTGSVAAHNLVITDVLPVGVSYDSGAASIPEDSSNGHEQIWTSISELAPGGQVTIDIPVTVDPQAQDGTVLTNTATATYENDLGWPFSREDTDVTTVIAEGFIDGYAFEDEDGDGVRDPGELGIADVTVELDSPIDGTLSDVTDGDGHYRFRLTAQQPVTVSASLPVDHFRTTPGTVYHDASLWVTQTINFGYAPVSSPFGSVYGTVYEDADHDGVRESGEPGLSGVELQSDEALNPSVTTNDLGQYTFSYEAPGTVTVTESNPAGYVSTTPDEVVQAVSLGSSTQVDFGDYAGIKITGQVFEDQNVNGANDGEPGIADVQVSIAGDTLTTEADGTYSHYMTLPGSAITITETDLDGYRSTNAIGQPSDQITRVDENRLRIDAPVAGTVYYGDFGDVLASDVVTITGRVWRDDNADGTYDPGEPGLAGAVVGITDGMTQTTAADGIFTLYAVPSSAIELTEANPDGYVSTNALPGNDAVKVDNDTLRISLPSAGTTSSENYFGDALTDETAVISGTVYDDENENGVLDAGEAGLPGVTVTLEILDGATIPVQTDANGGYQFAVAPGTDVRITSAGPGGDYGPTTPESVTARPPTAGNYPDVNFGYSDNPERPSLIHGLVYDDRDGNGRHDLGEPGLAGAVVTLDGAMPITTSGNGLITGTYVYRVSAARAYVVGEQDPPGYRSTTPNTVHVAVSDTPGGTYMVNFGDSDRTDVAWIHGTVFKDQDVNAAWGPDEPGLAGVTVTLAGSAAGLPEAGLTNEWGQYTFMVEETGTYTVTETDLDDYVSTNAIPGSAAATRIDDNTLRIEVSELGTSLGDNLFGDALESEVVTISGTVWDDNGTGGTAGDGVRDAGEPGLADATVSLSSGMVTTTDGSGSYTLYGPPDTAITVSEANPANYVSTDAIAGSGAVRVDADTLTVTGLGAGAASTGNMFGDVLPADLSVDKAASPVPAVAGDVLSYAISYSNDGPSYAQNVQIVDALPAEVSYEGMVSMPEGWSGPVYNDVERTLTWTAEELPAGASGTITFSVRPVPDASGELTNEVTIESNMPDTAPGGNTAQLVTPLTAEADLTVSKTSAASVVAGTQLTYTLNVENTGPSYAHDVVLTDILPTGVQLFEATAGYVEDGQTLTWDLGTMTNGEARAITIVVVVESGVSGWVTNTAEVTASTFDPQAPNVAERVVYVGTVADLRITKGGEPAGTVVAGTQLTYTLEIENAGSSDAQDVVVTDTLPAGVSLVETSGSYTQDGQQVVWQLGMLANGDSATIVLVTEVGSDVVGWITNTAAVGSATYDPFDANEAQLATWVETEADLSIVKSASPDPVAGQGTLTYRLDYRNDGPSDAQDVCIVDTLPEDVSWDGVSGQPGWNAPAYDAGAHSVTWCRDTLAADVAGTITFEVTVLPGIGTLSNSVAIGSETTDPDPADNAPAPTETQIGCGADAFEEDDAYTAAGEVAPGVWQDHNFADDSTDWLRFTAQRGFSYTIETSSWGQRADTFLRLYGPGGSTLLGANDDLEGTDDYSSQIRWQASADGTYYLQVTNRAGLTGCYTEYAVRVAQQAKYFLYLPLVMRDHASTVSVAPEVAPAEPAAQSEPATEVEEPAGAAVDTASDIGIQGLIDHPCPDACDEGDHDDTWETARPIASGVSQLHSFDGDWTTYAADKDFVWFELQAGQAITFTVTPVNGELPVLLELYDADGDALGISNEQGESQLAWEAPSAGRYYLSVTAWPGEEVSGCDDAAQYQLLAVKQPWWSLYLPIVLRSH